LIDEPTFRPGESASGSFRLTNQTGVREAIQLGATPSAHGLDRALELRLSSDGRILAEGTLGSFPGTDAAPLVLGPGQSATVEATASLSPTLGEEAAAGLVEVAITFEPKPGG
jgi:hypothetical protein